jgi:hypothetical protein
MATESTSNYPAPFLAPFGELLADYTVSELNRPVDISGIMPRVAAVDPFTQAAQQRAAQQAGLGSIQYDPETNKMNKHSLVNAPDLTLGTTYQKYSNPPCTLRASGWNRWEYLPHNPQDNFETPFDFFIPSRTQSKDAWIKQSCYKKIEFANHKP